MGEEHVLRWPKLARITHWLFFIGVTIAILTGLPVLDGSSFRFLYVLTGGETGRTILHYYATIVLLGVAAPLAVLRAIQSYRSRYEGGWWPGWSDVRDSIRIALRWLGLRKEYPTIGFRHPLEKFLVVSVHAGLILLGASGIPIVLFNVGYEYRALLLAVHDIGFLLVIIPLIGHFMLAINPVNWPTLKAMFTNGKVPVSWAKKHHPGWKIE